MGSIVFPTSYQITPCPGATLVRDYRVLSSRFGRLPALDNPSRHHLPRRVGTSDRTQTVKRRGVLSSEVNVLLRHTLSDRFDIVCGVSHPNLKVAVRPIAGKLVIAPLGRKEAKRCARLRIVVRQPGVVRLKKLLKPLIASFAL